MSEPSLSKSSVDRIGVKPTRTAQYYLGLVATLLSLAVGTVASDGQYLQPLGSNGTKWYSTRSDDHW